MTEDGKSQYLYLIGECFEVLSYVIFYFPFPDSVLKSVVPNDTNNEVNENIRSRHFLDHVENIR